MFRFLFTDIADAGFGFPGGAAGRCVTRAASLAAITVLMLGTLPSPAVAQRGPLGARPPLGPRGPQNPPVVGPVAPPPAANPSSTPLRVYFTNLYCIDESNDNTWPRPDRDEPYVVIFAADLRGGAASGRVFVSQEFSDVDAGDSRSDMLQFWSLNGNGSPIGSDDDYIFLAALMESDNSSNRTNIQQKLSSVLVSKLAGYKASGMSRSAMASALRVDMDLALEAFRDDHDDEDDRVGGIFEMIWGPNGLNAARAGHAVELFPEFVGSDSRYKLTFRLQ